MKVDGFKSLIAWEKAYRLAVEIYRISNSFPRDEQFGFTSQIRRAAISVSANIAEGYERFYRKEFMYFLRIAQGSLGELETYLLFAKDFGYIDVQQFNLTDDMRKEVCRLLRGLQYSLRNKNEMIV